MLKIPYISLVNIISGEETVKELVAHEYTVQSTTDCLSDLLYNNDYINSVKAGYNKVKTILGDSIASNAAAEHIVRILQNKR